MTACFQGKIRLGQAPSPGRDSSHKALNRWTRAFFDAKDVKCP